jgi:hypothetical protein
MRLLTLIVSVAILAALPCAAQENQLIYDDALQNGWQNYGWATLNYANTTPVHGGSLSISVTDPGTSYQAISLHHSKQDTSLYQSVSFWIYVTTSAAQPLQVKATRNGATQTVVKLSNLTVNGWKQVTLSLASLGVANVTDFDGFWIQNATGGPQTFYVDDVALIAAPPPNPVQLSIDAGSVIRTIDDRIFGINTAMWDSNLGSASSGSILASAGATVLRFPGGSRSDDYDWQVNRSVIVNTFNWASHAATFARVAEARGAQSCITVNYGSGTPEQAAAWVAYCNANTSDTTTLGVDSKGRDWRTAGYWAALRAASPLASDDGYNFLRVAHSAPYRFKYWEIGNECYGSWETDLHGAAGSGLTGTAHDPFTYAQSFAAFRAKMLAVDSSIRIGAVAVPGEDAYGNGTHAVPNPNSGGSLHSGWTPVVLGTLASLGVTPHFLVHHYYAQSPGSESDAVLLQSSALIASDAANLRKMITDYAGTGGTGIELQMTEANSVGYNPGKQSVSLVNALYFADVIGQLARTEFNACIWWDLRNSALAGNNNASTLYGWRQFGDYGIVATGDRADTPLDTRYPAFYAAKLLTHWGRGGDQVLAALTNYKLLAIHAARLANGSLALLVVNKSSVNDLTAKIALTSFLPGSTTASVFSYGKPNDLANDDLTAGLITNASSSFTATFPSYSVTMIVLSKPQSFEAWRAANFTAAELADPSISGATADPSGRGICNLLAYALRIDPRPASTTTALTPAAGSTSGQLAAPAAQPTTAAVSGSMVLAGNTYTTLSFTLPRTIGDVVYTVQSSDDLMTWHSGPAYVVRVDDGSTDQAVFRDATPVGTGGRRFLRLQVTLQP